MILDGSRLNILNKKIAENTACQAEDVLIVLGFFISFQPAIVGNCKLVSKLLKMKAVFYQQAYLVQVRNIFYSVCVSFFHCPATLSGE